MMFKFGGVPMGLKHRWGEKVRDPRCGRVKENDVPKKRRRSKRGERRRHKAIVARKGIIGVHFCWSTIETETMAKY